MSNQKEIILQFYERQIEEDAYLVDGFSYFMPDNRIGRVELMATGDWGEYSCIADFDSVESEKISSAVPQIVIEAFDRHTWFSQYSISSVFAFKIPVEGQNTYAIGTSGKAGDGWDNCGNFIEVFEESGTFLGAAIIGQEEKLVWLDRYIDGSDFNSGAPKWTGSPPPEIYGDKLWSKEVAVSIEQDGEISRLVLLAPD